METLFIGKNLIFLPETNSTNSYAIELLKNVNPPEGTVIHTAHQLRGKGQRGSAWTTEPLQNLTASVILKPGFLELKYQFFLYIIAALAVYDTTAEILDSSQFDIKIKWPNDILVNRKKIAGILIENKLLHHVMEWSIVGIGLNVNQENFEGLNATSLKSKGEQEIKVQDVLNRLCRHLEKFYLLLKSEKYEFLRDLYIQRLFGLNETLKFRMNNAVRHLRVKGIAAGGLLLLETEEKAMLEVDLKEVEWML